MEGDNPELDNSQLQMKEIDEVKATFGGNVKVISGIGAFMHVVTISHEGQNLHCKFQLTASYPESVPTISIRSNGLDSDLTASLVTYLQDEASTKLGQNMLVDLMTSCNQWLKDNDIDISADVVTEKTKNKKRAGKAKNSKKSKSENEEDDMFKKKPPMKTAADVIKRLQWDKSVDKNDFIVGYMDRIVGLVEKAFTAFTWEDLASVDMFSLAIPQHRIQYFKYKSEKVWDKNERLDNVFGSTGSKLTIVDAIKVYEDKIKEKYAESNEEKDVQLQQESTESEDGSAVSDDEQEVNDSQLGQVIEMASSNRQSFRPNYFTTVQLTDENTVRNLLRVQNEILSRHPQYEEFKTPSNGFHLTLSVLLLDSDHDVDMCIDAMKNATSELKTLALETKPLSFQGVDNFDTNRVVYAKVSFSQEFQTLVDKINNVLLEAGVRVNISAPQPHISLFKVPGKVYKSRQWRKENVVLTDNETFEFGSQVVNNIQVCRMGTSRDQPGSTGFYRTSIFKLLVN